MRNTVWTLEQQSICQSRFSSFHGKIWQFSIKIVVSVVDKWWFSVIRSLCWFLIAQKSDKIRVKKIGPICCIIESRTVWMPKREISFSENLDTKVEEKKHFIFQKEIKKLWWLKILSIFRLFARFAKYGLVVFYSS